MDGARGRECDRVDFGLVEEAADALADFGRGVRRINSNNVDLAAAFQERFGERLAGWSDRDITAFARMVERFLNDFGQGESGAGG